MYDSGEERGRAFIVMERLTGRTLADEIADGPFAATRVRRLADALLDALDAAHQAGVLHRDLKPSNVLVAGREHWKLTDFGIAKILDETDATTTGTVVGTPAYLAPERHLGAPATDGSDVYSLGVVLYEAAAGGRPFQGDNAVAVAQAAVTGAAVPLAVRRPELDAPLVDAIDRADGPGPGGPLCERGRDAPGPGGGSRSGDDDAAVVADTDGDASSSGRLRRTAGVCAPTCARTPRRWGLAALAAGMLAAAVLALVLLLGSGSPSTATPPSTAAPTVPSPLPAPLDHALTRLGQAVQP